jgi:hypothetical protein
MALAILARLRPLYGRLREVPLPAKAARAPRPEIENTPRGRPVPMKNRRAFLLTLTAGVVAVAVIITPVIADEFFGFITKIDAEGKKLTVTKKDDSEVEVKVTDSTELVTAKGSAPLDFEKLQKGLTKYKDAGVKGIPVIVSHENNVASKIRVAQKKKSDN